MERLIKVARQRGARHFVGAVLGENPRMRALAQDLGFREGSAIDRDVIRVVLDL